MGFLSGNQFLSDAQPLAKIHRPGFVGDEGIGPGLHQILADSLGPHNAADAGGGFKYRKLKRLLPRFPEFQQPMGRGESAQSSAHDRDSPRLMHDRLQAHQDVD
jgi:hypothetical protein